MVAGEEALQLKGEGEWQENQKGGWCLGHKKHLEIHIELLL